jgi:hypothetical protein
MSIDNALNPITCAPAERNVSHIGRETDLCFAPLERGESFGGRAFYKHLAPLGRSNNLDSLHFQIEFAKLKRLCLLPLDGASRMRTCEVH